MDNVPCIKQKNKINWKKGSAELIGLGMAFPLLCLMIITIIGIMQTGIMRQSLEYTNYMSARAAVVCDNYADALAQAKSTAVMTLSDTTFGVYLDDMKVSVTLVGGTSSTNGSGITWEKGALAKCQITLPYKSLIDFKVHTMSSTLYVMVEQPAKTYY